MFIPREILLLVGLVLMAAGLALMLHASWRARRVRRQERRDRATALDRLSGYGA